MFSKIDFKEVKKVLFSLPNKETKYIKANIKNIMIKDKECYQVSLFTKTQVFHENIDIAELKEKVETLFSVEFNQMEILTDSYIYGFKISSKGKFLSNKRNNTEKINISSHNKEKNYLLKEGIVVPPLVDLGVMTEDGKVVKAYYDKFKQINKFLEIIDDTIKDEKKLNIIDFGCGKSYLTFILYYYLTYFKKIEANIIGLDLKQDVINNCNKLRDKYGYKNLRFEIGDISLYKPVDRVDMIITLHACDTATDHAL